MFLDILYNQLVKGESVTRYPWATPQFYTDLLQHLLNRAYNSLEWCLNSPPKPHAFSSLPLQSDLGFIIEALNALSRFIEIYENRALDALVHFNNICVTVLDIEYDSNLLDEIEHIELSLQILTHVSEESYATTLDLHISDAVLQNNVKIVRELE